MRNQIVISLDKVKDTSLTGPALLNRWNAMKPMLNRVLPLSYLSLKLDGHREADIDLGTITIYEYQLSSSSAKTMIPETDYDGHTTQKHGETRKTTFNINGDGISAFQVEWLERHGMPSSECELSPTEAEDIFEQVLAKLEQYCSDQETNNKGFINSFTQGLRLRFRQIAGGIETLLSGPDQCL